MAAVGRIVSRTLPSGRIAWRIDFGERGARGQRRRVYLDTVPDEFGTGRAPLRDPSHAQQVLDRIHAQMAAGRSLERVLSEIRSGTAPEDRMENRGAEWLAWLDGLERQGRRSPTYLRNLRAYWKPGGHIAAFWTGRSIHGVTHGDIEDWHGFLGSRGIGARTIKHVSDAFRAFLRRLARRGDIDACPPFPSIEVPEYLPKILPLDERARVLAAISWEARGAFLACSWLLMRGGEVRACNLDDFDRGCVSVSAALQGPSLGAPRRHTKARVSTRREVWEDELAAWITWRLAKATAELRLKGEIALFWNPRAANVAKRWTEKAMQKTWRRACKTVGVSIALREGTRHSTATALTEGGLATPLLQALGGWKSQEAMGHYTKPRARRAAIVQALPGGTNGRRQTDR